MSLARPNGNTARDPFALQEWLSDAYGEIEALRRRVTPSSVVTYTLAAGGFDNRVPHGLPGTVAEWTIVGKDANADVWQSPTPNPDRTVVLLRASAAVTVKLRFS